MNYTQHFRDITIPHDDSPTQTLIDFERIARKVMRECQEQVDRDQARLTQKEKPIDNQAILDEIQKKLFSAPGQFIDLIRVQAHNPNDITDKVTDYISRGHALVSKIEISDQYQGKGLALYFTKEDVSKSEFMAGHVDSVRAQIQADVERAKQTLKESEDDKKSLKKAIQARQAEIKTLSKLIAEF